MIRVLVPIILILLQVFLYKRAVRWVRGKFPDRSWPVTTLRFLFLIFNVPAIYFMFERPKLIEYPVWFTFTALYPYFIWHVATISLFLIILLGTIVKLPFVGFAWLSRKIPAANKKIEQVQNTDSFESFDATRRVFIQRSMYALTATAFGGGAYGMFVGRSNYEIHEVEFAIRNLPPAFNGFTIGMMSDIHSSVFMPKKEMDEYVKILNSLKTDLAIVNGDFINSAIEEVYPFAEAFSNLAAPFGVYGVMGNHDFYNQDPERVARVVDDCGVKLLRNDKLTIQKNGEQIYLIGVDDPGRMNSAPIKLNEAIGYSPLNIPRILLCHKPYYLPVASKHNIDLVLSGHTHGGQVVFGRFGDIVIAPASLASRYVWGKYELDGTQMYVNRGIGTVGAPIRMNCPPEITKITLRPLV